jgi:hypothetical protein
MKSSSAAGKGALDVSNVAELKVAFSRPWSIRLPVVTRYLDEPHVESFFKEGRLRLPSFRTFREHKDEVRGDQLEGRVSAEIRGPNVRHSVLAINGQAAFILSATLVENRNMETSFSTAAGIRILNTVAFANAISTHIPRFVGGCQGNCIYREDTTLKKRSQQPFSPPKDGQDPEEWAANQDRFIADQIAEGFFYKRLMYAYQTEYRFVWFGLGEETRELFVTCPEAVKFCERI